LGVPDARLHGLGLEAIGVPAPFGRAFIACGAQILFAFDLHRSVKDQFEHLGQDIEPVRIHEFRYLAG
jgi:hypothetical protein